MSLPLHLAPAADFATDPVCGMRIDPARAAAHIDHAGVTYHFCSTGCARRFQEDPTRFLAAPGTATMQAANEPVADQSGLASYAPLAVVLLLILCSTLVLAWRDLRSGQFSAAAAIVHFMAGFFLVFAGFKLLDLSGFAEGYATYDLLASRWHGYGLLYPFIELGFGLSMLAGVQPTWLLWGEISVMAFSGLGVAIKLAKKEPFTCACLGTFLKVPLTKVTLVEDFGMATLAAVLLVLHAS